MTVDPEKLAILLHAKAQLRESLRQQSWEEKVWAIERMNEMSRVAKASMEQALMEEAKARDGA
jgi:hypothetical protein